MSLEAHYAFVRESNSLKRRATRLISDEVQNEARARAMDQFLKVAPVEDNSDFVEPLVF